MRISDWSSDVCSSDLIAEASNSALEIARGEYVALLDHDDELHPHALLECVSAFQHNPDWQMLFTDEDKIDEQGERSDPYFKSDWNPDLFFSQNCVCHLMVYRRELVEQVGGFRAGRTEELGVGKGGVRTGRCRGE